MLRRGAAEALEGLVDDFARVGFTPLTTDPAEAEPWLQGGEGVIAKELSSTCSPASARAW